MNRAENSRCHFLILMELKGHTFDTGTVIIHYAEIPSSGTPLVLLYNERKEPVVTALRNFLQTVNDEE